MDLTQEELGFLRNQRLSISDILDCRQLRGQDCRQLAKQQKKTLILGTPCEKQGHRLRTRYGHCAQCDPKKISFQSRKSRNGFVYIAGSLDKKFLKIGSTENIENREQTLRSQKYGNASDWKILCYVEIKSAGAVEREIQKRLSGKFVKTSYMKDGRHQETYEIYSCSFSFAAATLCDVLENMKCYVLENKKSGFLPTNGWQNYNFD